MPPPALATPTTLPPMPRCRMSPRGTRCPPSATATLDQWLSFVTAIKFARGADQGKPSWILTYGYRSADAERLAGVILAEGANYYETRGPSMADSVGIGYRQRIFSWTAVHQEALYGGEAGATAA